MSPRHCAVFASRGTTVGAEVCCLDIGLRHISRLHWVSSYRGACSVRVFDSIIFSIIVILLSCHAFTCFTCKKLTKIIGFIGHAIMSNFVLCALNILIF